MRRIYGLLVFVLLLSPSGVRAQLPDYPGDTLDFFTTISFEEPTPYITLDPGPQNVWQIGTPQKLLFDSAFTVPNAIITDTISPYPVGNHSSFTLIIGDFNMGGFGWGYYYDVFIDFRHKYDTDTLQDGGYMEVSWDKGLTWMNIIHDTAYPGFTPGWYGFWSSTNLYSVSDTLYNGENGFSGTSGGWIHSCMGWGVLPVKQGYWEPPDTMMVRFNFVSDNENNNREGWMIDQIRLFSIDLGSGIGDQKGQASHFRVFPNPITDVSWLALDKASGPISCEWIDLNGATVRKDEFHGGALFPLSKGTLPAGIYLLKVAVGNDVPEFHKVMVKE